VNITLVRYLAVGVVNTVLGLLVIYALKRLAEVEDTTANLVGYCVGILFGFQLNKRWTFSHLGDNWLTLLRYVMVLSVAYITNLAVVLYAIEVLQINSYLAQTTGVVPFTIIGFLGSRYFVFRDWTRASCRGDRSKRQ
jgi:putative flippase GtrA